MTQNFECEVRILISDIIKFENFLKTIGASTIFKYDFSDYYYQLKNENWDPNLKNIRIREWKYPDKGTYIALVKNKIKGNFKRSLYKEGKLKLYSGTLDECKNILTDLGFEPWLVVKKENAKIVQINDFKIALEFIKQIGWSAEIEVEGTDLEKAAQLIKQRLETLKAVNTSYETVASMVAKAQYQQS